MSSTGVLGGSTENTFAVRFLDPIPDDTSFDRSSFLCDIQQSREFTGLVSRGTALHANTVLEA